MSEQIDNWNDDRLGELATDVKAGFARVEAQMKEGFAKVDQRLEKVDARFEKVDARFEKVDARFEKVDARFERLYRLLFVSAISIVGVLIAALAAALTT